MDGIKIKIARKRAILNKMVAAITNGKDMKPLQQEWLMEYVEAVIKEKSDKRAPHNFTQKDIIDCLKENGLKPDCITDKTNQRKESYWRGSHDEFMSIKHSVKFNSYTVDFTHYTGGNAQGSYYGVHANFFGSNHYIDLRFIPLQTVVSMLEELDDLIPQWKEELWPDFLLEAQKMAKMKSLNENTIETLVKGKLIGTGIQYYTEKQSNRVKMYFNINGKLQVEWFISHKSFMQQIDTVIDAVKTIKKTSDETGTTFTVKKLDSSIRWQ